MAKTQLFTVTNGVITFTTNSATVGGATSRETVKFTLYPLDPALPAQDLVQGTDFENGDFRVDGVGDASNAIRVYWPDAAQNVGAMVLINIYTDLANPVDAQLHNFQSSGTNTPRQFQEQIQQIFSIFAQVVGTGGSLGDISLADTLVTKENMIALVNQVFVSPVFDVVTGAWEGNDVLPFPVEQMYGVLQDLADQINGDAGLPVPLIPTFILQAQTSMDADWVDADVLLQSLASYIALEGRVTVLEPIVGTNTTNITNLQNDKYDKPGGNTVWHSGNDGPGSGLNADLLDGFHAETAPTASTIAIRDGAGRVSVGQGGNVDEAVRVDQFLSMFLPVSGVFHRISSFIDLPVLFIDGNTVGAEITLPSTNTRDYFACGFDDLGGIGLKSEDVHCYFTGTAGGSPQNVVVANNGSGNVEIGELDVRCYYNAS